MLILYRALVIFFATLVFAAGVHAVEDSPSKIEYAIAIHGGALSKQSKLTDAEKEQYRRTLARLLKTGCTMLAEGRRAIDVVEETIRRMEDDPIFNAGRGAVFNRVGRHELDASIMDGRTHQAGAVAAVTTVKNPISLARLVMTETRHVLLSSEGADKFADEMKDKPQIQRVPNRYFSTDKRRRQWREAVEMEKKEKDQTTPLRPGTVGCVALDKKGNLAAGTSTGGLTNKKWGRVGDSPIIGAGTYADNATCAVSGTGIGEYFIRSSAAFHVSALMAYQGLSVDEAVRYVLKKVLPPDTGGIIALDRHGRISMHFNTPGMLRAAADSTGKTEIRLMK